MLAAQNMLSPVAGIRGDAVDFRRKLRHLLLQSQAISL